MKRGQAYFTDALLSVLLMIFMIIFSTTILIYKVNESSNRIKVLEEQAERITRSDSIINSPKELGKYNETQRRVVPQTIQEKEINGTEIMSVDEAMEKPVEGLRRLAFLEKEGGTVVVIEVK